MISLNLRWAKSRESYRRIASENYRSDSTLKTQHLVLVDPAFVALRFESRDWRSLGVRWCSIRSTWTCGMGHTVWPARVDRVRWSLAIGDWRFGPSKLWTPRIWSAYVLPNPALQSCSLPEPRPRQATKICNFRGSFSTGFSQFSPVDISFSLQRFLCNFVRILNHPKMRRNSPDIQVKRTTKSPVTSLAVVAFSVLIYMCVCGRAPGSGVRRIGTNCAWLSAGSGHLLLFPCLGSPNIVLRDAHKKEVWGKHFLSGQERERHVPFKLLGLVHRETKGWFRKRMVLTNVPSFRFSFWGNMWMYPRSGFCSKVTCEYALVPGFGTGEHPPKPPFWKPPFCKSPISIVVDPSEGGELWIRKSFTYLVTICLQFPNAVVLNAVGCRNTQMHAKEHKWVP